MASRRKVALSDYEMTTTLGTGKDKELIIKVPLGEFVCQRTGRLGSTLP
jgi:hypothetical protein